MRVLHISPTYFDDASFVGGGERYALELARAMADDVATTLISFGSKHQRLRRDKLEIELFPTRYWISGVKANPFSLRFLPRLADFDVVHCHQFHTVVTNLVILHSKLTGRPIFVSDLGGGGGFDLSYHVDLGRWVNGYLMISDFTAQHYHRYSGRSLIRTVYGGVDTAKFHPAEGPREHKVVFVGRLLSLKGINYLIEAIDPDVRLVIIGRPYEPEYVTYLRSIASSKNVEFVLDADDQRILREYQTASVLVLPTVERDYNGHAVTAGGEIFGLVLVEAMACATPVICTRTGGMPEVVREGDVGFLVPPGDVRALRDRIRWILDHPAEARAMGLRGRQLVLQNFTWRIVSDRCLDAYRMVLSPSLV